MVSQSYIQVDREEQASFQACGEMDDASEWKVMVPVQGRHGYIKCALI